MQLYTEDYTDTFPAHRNQNMDTTDATVSLTNWWGTTIATYGGGRSNLFHDPAIAGKRLDDGTAWVWNFDCDLVGYGYNGYFLGHHPYRSDDLVVGGIQFPVGIKFKRSSVLRARLQSLEEENRLLKVLFRVNQALGQIEKVDDSRAASSISFSKFPAPNAPTACSSKNHRPERSTLRREITLSSLP